MVPFPLSRPRRSSLALSLALLALPSALADNVPPSPAAPSTAAAPATPVASYLNKVRLESDVANAVLKSAIGLEDESLIRTALRLGADPEVLHNSPYRFRSWLCLCLDEEYYPQTGKPCSYSEEDWAVLFDFERERYMHGALAKKMAQYLIEKGVDINKPSSKGLALALALKSYQPHVIQAALDVGAKPELLSPAERAKMEEILNKDYSHTITLSAALEGEALARGTLRDALRLMDESVLGEATIAGADYDVATEEEAAAALEEAMQLIRALPNAQEILDEYLHLEALYFAKSPAPLLYLIEQGANINFASENLIYGVGGKYPDQVRTVLSYVASRRNPQPEIVQALIDKGARFMMNEDGAEPDAAPSEKGGLNAQQNGFTPLMMHLRGDLGWATLYYAPCAATEFYLSFGADPNLQNKEGKTALFYASEDDKIRNLLALLKAKPDVNHRDAVGRTALFTAVEQGGVLAALALLEAGADPFAKDNSGNSLLDCKADEDARMLWDVEERTARAIAIIKAYQQAMK